MVSVLPSKQRSDRASRTTHWPADPAPRAIVRRRGRAAPWWFAVPALLLFAFVVLVPSARGVYYAFTDWDGLDPDFSFIGLGNFTQMLDDPQAMQAIWHTLLIAVAITVIQNGVRPTARARRQQRDQVAQRAAGVPVRPGGGHPDRDRLPVAEPARPGRRGQQPARRGRAGSWQQDWLGNPQLALWSIVGVIVWQFGGYSMVIFLAGLQSIPREIYEAAAIDGGGPLRRFWSVTRPLLAPAFTINLMLSIIGGIKLFDQVYALTGGGPGHATDTMSTLIYKDAFTLGEFGYSIALAVVLTVIVAVVSTGQYVVLARNERAAS